MLPIPGWAGHVFHLSQAYPSRPAVDARPWLAFDPTRQPSQYLAAVLRYFYEGNIRSDVELSFDPALNPVRRWYNAPWQDPGLNGREFVHGLTRERVSRPYELDPHQAKMWNNYAVGFYNSAGGATIGRVWRDHGRPDARLAHFPEGTVAAKLIFTTADTTDVPYLAGAPTWNAYVYARPNELNPPAGSPRAILPLHLLQIDLAVKDSRVNNTTGWVFGTYVYGGGPGGTGGSGWTNVAAVGEMWGNDPGYPGSGPLRQTLINRNVHMLHVGYQGRLNGPIDNQVSSCLSCHATAEVPEGIMTPPSGQNPARWFQNISSGNPFDIGSVATDYSLQLSVGIANFNAHQAVLRASPAQRALLIQHLNALDQRPPRDGGPFH